MSSRPSRGAARLAAILDALPDALLLVNCNGTVVNANTIALETFEAPGTALVGRGLLDLLPTFDSKRIPGSMRRRDEEIEGPRTKPTRMVARRTDGTELLVEVTSANLEDGRTPYESAFEAAYAEHRTGYTGDELLMLVVRDLTGTLDTETELARQQRQTEMILRAAAEGVVGVDAEGKVVLVNPSAAQILGFRASELGGKELHPLIHHSRADGSPLPWEDTPLADTLKSGRKHRVRGQALWAKDGRAVSVDLTTAPVRDGDQLVGAVMTFTDRRPYDALAARHAQLLAVLDQALRGPLEELNGELSTLASDPAGQLWPEANQILHHLAAGHARMTTLVDNVLSYQRLDSGTDRLNRAKVSLDGVVAAGVEGAIELIGPGRAQFAVHAPPIEATVDADRIAQALSHLIADVAGVDSTGRMSAGGGDAGARTGPVPGDSTIVVAAAQRGDVVRIEVRGPYGGGDPVHGPIVRGIVRQHGGLVQTHDVPGAPGAGGSAYVLELPMAADGAAAQAESAPETTGNETTVMPVPAARARGTQAADATDGAGVRQQGDEGTEGGDGGAGGSGGPGGGPGPGGSDGTDGGGLGGATAQSSSDGGGVALPAQANGAQPTGRRRARHSGAEQGETSGGPRALGPGQGHRRAGRGRPPRMTAVRLRQPRAAIRVARPAAVRRAARRVPQPQPQHGNAAGRSEGDSHGGDRARQGLRCLRAPRPFRRAAGDGRGRRRRRAARCPRSRRGAAGRSHRATPRRRHRPQTQPGTGQAHEQRQGGPQGLSPVQPAAGGRAARWPRRPSGPRRASGAPGAPVGRDTAAGRRAASVVRPVRGFAVARRGAYGVRAAARRGGPVPAVGRRPCPRRRVRRTAVAPAGAGRAVRWRAGPTGGTG